MQGSIELKINFSLCTGKNSHTQCHVSISKYYNYYSIPLLFNIQVAQEFLLVNHPDRMLRVPA